MAVFAFWRALPSILAKYHPGIEQIVSHVLDHPVKIGGIKVSWSYLSPEIHFRDVLVWNDERTHSLLKVDELHINIAFWRSLFKWQIIPEQLEISGAEITLRKNQQNRWSIDGMRGLMSAEPLDNQRELWIKLEKWLFSKRKWVFKNIRLNIYPSDNSFFLLSSRLSRLPPRLSLLPPRLSMLSSHLSLLSSRGLTAGSSVFPFLTTLDPAVKPRDDSKGPRNDSRERWDENKGRGNDSKRPRDDNQYSFWITQLSLQYEPNIKQTLLQGEDIRLNLGKLFRNEIFIDELSATLILKKTPQDIIPSFKNVLLRNADLNLKGNFEWSTVSSLLDLKMNFEVNNVRNKSHYFPVEMMSPELVSWLDKAIINGKQIKGLFLLRGDLDRFPFDDKSGQFLIDANLSDFTLDYYPGWPIIKHLDARLIFAGRKLDIEAHTGKILTTTFQHVRAEFPDLTSKIPQLNITAEIAANISEGLQVITESPLKKTLGKELAGLDLKGPMQLHLELGIPLGGASPVKVMGIVNMKNNRLFNKAWDVELSQLTGPLNFTADTVSAQAIKGRFLNSPVSIDVKKAANSDTLEISATGQFEPKKNKIVAGKIDYRMDLSLPSVASKKQGFLILSSNLKGLKIDLPEPLGKKVEQIKPVEIKILTDHANFIPVNLLYNNNIRILANYSLRQKQFQNSIRVQSPTISGQIQIPSKTTQTWSATFERVYLPDSAQKLDKNQLRLSDIPAFNLRIADFHYGKKHLGQLELQVFPSGSEVLQIRKLALTEPNVQLNAQGSWKVLGKQQTQTHLTGQLKTQNIEDMLKYLGISGGIAGKSGNLDFDLSWPAAPYDLDLALLTGKATLQFKQGRIIDSGSKMSVQMGLGRLLTLLSVQTLHRRLTLDFSDLSHNDFSFDSLKGTFILTAGNATTNDIHLESLLASINLQGRIGLKAKDYDLQLQVTPHLTQSLPAVATIAGGPIAGATTWIAEKVLGGMVGHIMTQTYRIQGKWEKPIIYPLNR